MKAHIVRPHDLDETHLQRWRKIIGTNQLYRSPYYAPEFTCAVAAARNDVRVAIFEDEGTIAGFLPFHRLRCGVAKPVGGPISDYQGPILASEFSPEAAKLLNVSGIAAYDFNHLPEAISTFSAFSVSHSLSPHIDVSHGFDAYEADRRKTLKQTMSTMARRRRKLEREVGPVRFVFQDTSDDAFAWLKAKKAEQFPGRRQILFDVPWIGETLHRIRRESSPEFAGVMSALYAGDRLMAAHFGMRSSSCLHWWFPTYDRSATKYSSGILLLLELARAACENGVSIIDLGRGDEPYKEKFSNGATRLCEGSVELAASFPGLLRKSQKAALRIAGQLPLGKYESLPRRALARLISGMELRAEN